MEVDQLRHSVTRQHLVFTTGLAYPGESLGCQLIVV